MGMLRLLVQREIQLLSGQSYPSNAQYSVLREKLSLQWKSLNQNCSIALTLANYSGPKQLTTKTNLNTFFQRTNTRRQHEAMFRAETSKNFQKIESEKENYGSMTCRFFFTTNLIEVHFYFVMHHSDHEAECFFWLLDFSSSCKFSKPFKQLMPHSRSFDVCDQ